MTGYWPFVKYVIQTYGVFIGTSFLGFVAGISIIITNRGLNRDRKARQEEIVNERKAKLYLKKIEEAYTPVVIRLIKSPKADRVEVDTNQIYEVKKILLEKDYLFYPKILKALPKDPPLSLSKGSDEYKQLMSDWESFYKAVWDERGKNLQKYLKLSGVTQEEYIDLDMPDPDIDLLGVIVNH